jgi:hypothetical protein
MLIFHAKELILKIKFQQMFFMKTCMQPLRTYLYVMNITDLT